LSQSDKIPCIFTDDQGYDARERFAAGCTIRHRVFISIDIPSESPNSATQRRHLKICGRGENHFRVIDGQFAGNISDANFGATFWASPG
jgi:hypothetical protein